MAQPSSILIADSGSTKTDWRLVTEQETIHQFRTGGLNPYFRSAEEVEHTLSAELVPALGPYLGKGPLDIFFYGAGCSSEEKCSIIRKGLTPCFPSAAIHVEHDLLAAARSLCGHEKGIAAILGTGSNSCLYDGKVITHNIASLGYILGDEGSGASLGKQWVMHFLYGELPPELEKSFSGQYKLDKDSILEKVYKQPAPNTFLASFTPFLLRNITHPFVTKLVYRSFDDFFIHHIMKYPASPGIKLHCTGSVGFYFGDILKAVARDRNITVGTITESPIAGLTLYHTSGR